MNRTTILAPALALCVLVATACGKAPVQTSEASVKPMAKSASDTSIPDPIVPVVHTPEEWKKLLTPEQYHVLREQGTEIAFTGAYWNNHEAGTYVCAACGLPLFSSKAKFESGTGWPSYWEPIDPRVLKIATDMDLGYSRDELSCARCGGHLGHVFDDGPPPTGKRYCIDSVSLDFKPDAVSQAPTTR